MSCLDCKWSDDSVRRNGNIKCNHPESPWKWCAIDISCRRFTAKPPTIFHQITASPEVLAEEFVAEFSIYGGRCYWFSLLLAEKGHSVFEQRFNTKAEAIAATVARLNEVCDD